MDIEKSHDSDTSESWSLLDLNETEIVTEAGDGTVIVNPGSNNRGDYAHPGERVETINSLPEPSAVSEPSTNHQDFQVLYKGKRFQRDDELEKLSENNSNKEINIEGDQTDKNQKDFNTDSDSISIISENECDDVKFSPSETDDFSEGKLSDSNLESRTQPNVLKRKRKRLKLNYRESSEESMSSDFMIPDGNYYSNVQSMDYKKSDNEMQVTEYHGAPVYRHYRNNVANTVLSLAMGIIFTGVACIAIGHFLGVHDAQHTAGEMMATLKRLQMENVLLHTRLAQLSRAFFNRGSNKMRLLAKEEPQGCFNNYIDVHHTVKNNEKEEHGERPIFFHGRPIDFSADFKNQETKVTINENKIGMLSQDHDQQDFFNITNFGESYCKIPHSTSVFVRDELVGKQKEKKLKLNCVKERKKILKTLADCRVSDRPENPKQDCLAVREKDLSRFRWFLLERKKRRNADIAKATSGGTYIYKYPQPEEYYKNEVKIMDESDKIARAFNNLTRSDDSYNMQYGRVSQFNSSYPLNSTGERIDAKTKIFPKDKETKTYRDKTGEAKRNDRSPSKIDDDDDDDDDCEDDKVKGHKKYKNHIPKKNRKNNEQRKKVTEFRKEKRSRHQKEKSTKKGNENGRRVQKDGKAKRAKARREQYLPQAKIWNNARNVIAREGGVKIGNWTMCEECARRSGSWFYRWAKGRENLRKELRLSDWQFARARSRAHSRVGDAHWQFRRAMGRETSRNDQFFHFRKRDAKYSHQKEFPSDAYSLSVKKKHFKTFINLF